MKNDINIKIKIQNPKNLSEKISKKNPPKKALKIPEFSDGFSKRFIRITEIKMKFGIIPEILKWIKKLVWNKAKI